MAYCPEDGWQMDAIEMMDKVEDNVAFAGYHCPECHTNWQYDAEQRCYRVIVPEGQNGG